VKFNRAQTVGGPDDDWPQRPLDGRSEDLVRWRGWTSRFVDGNDRRDDAERASGDLDDHCVPRWSVPHPNVLHGPELTVKPGVAGKTKQGFFWTLCPPNGRPKRGLFFDGEAAPKAGAGLPPSSPPPLAMSSNECRRVCCLGELPSLRARDLGAPLAGARGRVPRPRRSSEVRGFWTGASQGEE